MDTRLNSKDDLFGIYIVNIFVYQIFNPNNVDDEFGGWSSPGTMEFCVHGTNDQPVLVLPYSDGNVDNITTHSFNEDEDLTSEILYAIWYLRWSAHECGGWDAWY